MFSSISAKILLQKDVSFLDCPHNQRELHRKAELIIGMTGNSTTITDPAAASSGGDSSMHTKSFTFDYSYWSHDGFVEKKDGYLAPSSTKYADQAIKC